MAGGAEAVLGLSAAAAWGSADFSGGLATRRAAPAFIVFAAHGFSLLILAALAAVSGDLSSGREVYALVSGVFYGTGLIALYSALSRGAMGLCAAISGVVSAILPVLYSWFREEHAAPPRLAGFVVAVAAIWLVSYTKEPGSRADRNGLLLALVAGLSFGAMLILMHLSAAGGPLHALIWMRIASTITAGVVGLILWLWKGRKVPGSVRFPAGKTLLLAILAGVLDASGIFLYLHASMAGRLDVAAVLSSLYPAATMLLAAWLLKERATRSQMAGMALAIAAIVLISM
jgi:drug/metabolite transporter (DMT)-like permease